MRYEIRSSPHPALPGGQPLKIGDRFLLVPGNTPIKGTDRIVITLTRGKAFGSGLHETTVSCMESIESLGPLEDHTVLDVGTGTGILSMAAIKLGAVAAVALDVDRDAARTCRDNAILNKVSEQLCIYQGTLEALKPSLSFDLVMANIYGDIIIKAAQKLAGHTGEGGHMILSGIDYTDSAPVKTAMARNGLEEVAVNFLEDYVTQVWRRPPGRVRKEP